MKKIIESDIVISGEFLPLDSDKKINAEIVLIERGLTK